MDSCPHYRLDVFSTVLKTMFENPRRGRQARNFTTNVPKILDLKSSSEEIFSRKLSLGAPVSYESSIGRTGYSSFLGGNLTKVGGE